MKKKDKTAANAQSCAPAKKKKTIVSIITTLSEEILLPFISKEKKAYRSSLKNQKINRKKSLKRW